MKANVKLTVRYIILVFFTYMAYMSVSPDYLQSIKDMPKEVIIAINVSVFGALTLILKYHFETKIEE
jgi:hypothetical protein